MKKYFLFCIIIFYILINDNVQAQSDRFPKDKMNRIEKDAYQRIVQQQSLPVGDLSVSQNTLKQTVLNKVLNPDNLKSLSSTNALKSEIINDTLIVGGTPDDSLIITGNYTFDGTIIILNNGILRFKNADATINGDIIVYGYHAVLTADSSTLHFPQLYIYNRYMLVAGNGQVTYNNTTLDYSYLSHGLTITDSAKMIMNHVTNFGFTTCGLSKKPTLTINGTNLGGEFILSDQANVSISNADTVLVWHQIPAGGVLDFSFPQPDTVQTYSFNDTTPGVSGIGYSVTLNTCYHVMWGLMPTTGSDVKISNSTMRTIGVWFQGNDTVEVTGLVDNSFYTDFTADLTDKNLQLINTNVQTWSIYSFDKTNISISNCTLGEVGAQNESQINTITSFLDGSGGYWWSTDSAFATGYFSYSTMVRSEKNSMFLFAYSTLVFGTASAIDHSILFVLQCNLPSDPVPYNESEVWMANISSPDTGNVDKLIPITGSAWIEKTATSNLMDFGSYRVFYQKPGDTSWISLTFSKTEINHDTLAIWNTNGFIAGTYTLKLDLYDNAPDSNNIEALKSVTLQTTTSVNKIKSGFNSEIIPNPFSENATVEFYLSYPVEVEISVLDDYGRIMRTTEIKGTSGINYFEMTEAELSSGIYFYTIKTSDYTEVKKFIKL